MKGKFVPLALAVLLLLPRPMTRAAGAASPEQLLSGDTIAVFSVPEWVKLSSLVEKSNYGQLWRDPEMRPFRDKTVARLREGFLEPVEKLLGFQLAEHLELAQGQMTFALTPGAGGTNAFGYIFLLDVRDKAGLLRTNLAEVKRKWVEAGQHIRSERIRDVEFATLLFTGEDVDAFFEKAFPDPEAKPRKKPLEDRRKKKFELRIGQSDSLLLIGTHAPDLEKVLARKAGGLGQPLGEQALFQSAASTLFRDAAFYAWLNFKPVFDAWMEANKTESKPRSAGLFTFRPDRAASAFGFAALRSVSFKLSSNPEGHSLEAFLDIPENTRQGLFKLLSAPPADSAPPPIVPADATKFHRWRLDGKETWSRLETILLGIAPEIAGILQLGVETIGKDKDPNFDFKKSFISALGNDFITYQKPPRSLKEEDVDSPPTIYLIGGAKPEQLASAFQATTSLMPPPMSAAPVKHREFAGKTIYSVPLDGVDIKNGALSFAGNAGYLAITADTPMLEEYLRSAESNARKLADMPGLREASEKVGGFGTGLFGYENRNQTMRTTIEAWKNDRGGLDRLLAVGGAAGKQIKAQEAELFDYSALPPFERISKYFGISVFSGSATAQGMSFKFFLPTPPGLKK